MPAPPSHAPKFKAIFDRKVIVVILLLVVLGVVSCDLLNRAIARRLSPQTREPDPASWTTGTSTRVVLALKTQDAERHACATNQKFENYRCEYEANKRRGTKPPNEPVDDNQRFLLQPFKSALGNHPLLLGGVWYTPEVAMRRHREPARDRRAAQLQTFYAECEVSFVGNLESLDVRYDFGKGWSPLKNVPVGRVDRCSILESLELSAAETASATAR